MYNTSGNWSYFWLKIQGNIHIGMAVEMCYESAVIFLIIKRQNIKMGPTESQKPTLNHWAIEQLFSSVHWTQMNYTLTHPKLSPRVPDHPVFRPVFCHSPPGHRHNVIHQGEGVEFGENTPWVCLQACSGHDTTATTDLQGFQNTNILLSSTRRYWQITKPHLRNTLSDAEMIRGVSVQ